MKDPIEIQTDEVCINISRDLAKEIIRQLMPDEIMDALREAEPKIKRSLVFNSIQYAYSNELGELLVKFFNHKSDANKYLTAEQQENLEVDFEIWCDSIPI